MKHVAADEVRRLLSIGRLDSAAEVLAAAWIESPRNPDLLAEQWIVRALRMDVHLDESLFDDIRLAPRYPRIIHMALSYCLAAGLTDWIEPLRHRLADLTPDHTLPALPPPQRPRVSAILITKNEEAMLPGCLASLHGAVDEVIVVDTGSSDRTVEIARDAGAVIGTFTWVDDFSLARNASLELATGDWALWIDADERLTPESASAIRRAARYPFLGGFHIEIVNFTDERENGDRFVHRPIRLFRRTLQTRFTGSIHEQVIDSLEAQGLPCVPLPGAQILHEGYRPAAMRERQKVERSIRLLENEVRAHPTDSFQWFNLGNALLAARRWAEAEHAVASCLRQIPPGVDYGELAYQIRSCALLEMGRLDEALRIADEADRRGYGGILNEFQRATALQRLGMLDQALEAADRCMAASWIEGRPGDRGVETHKRHVLRGQILTLLGRKEEALSMFDHALEVDPGFAPTLFSKGIALEGLGRLDEAEFHFQEATHEPSVRPSALKGLARVAAQKGDLATSAKLFHVAWTSNLEDQEAWAGWANACEASGDVQGVVEAFEAYAIHHDPSPGILLSWGRALDRVGDADRALEMLAEAIRRDPNQANAYFSGGDILYRLERFADAAHLYESGLRRLPGYAQGWFTLGNSLAQLGLYDAAETAYSQAMALNPHHPEAAHNLEIVRELSAA